jgi:hypothetical protein
MAANRQSQSAVVGIAQFVHRTNFKINPAANAPMFFVVEQDAYQAVGQSLYRLSVWRIVVFQPAAPDSRIPRKET